MNGIKQNQFCLYLCRLNKHITDDGSQRKCLTLVFFLWFILGFTVINPEYVVSGRGKFMLTQNGFNFTLAKKVQLPQYIRTYWRCTVKGSKTRKGCRATATCIECNGEEKAVFKGTHSHQPQSLSERFK